MSRIKHLLAFSVLLTSLSAAASAFANGDAAAGEKVFAQCKACHTIEDGKNKIGPSLFGVVGRKAGTVPGYAYSKNLLSSGVTWNAASLDRFLTDPKLLIPGNKMATALKDPLSRGNVIAYLSSKH